MPGFSVTLLLLPPKASASTPSPSLVLSLLDAPSEAPGWKWSSGVSPAAEPRTAPAASQSYANKDVRASHLESTNPLSFDASIERACKALIQAEPEITKMDTIAGDGDCGLTLKVCPIPFELRRD